MEHFLKSLTTAAAAWIWWIPAPFIGYWVGDWPGAVVAASLVGVIFLVIIVRVNSRS
jgi:hypothetical protein